MRLRLEYATHPHPGYYLADTPRRSCPDCQGDGFVEHGYQTPGGEPDFDHFPCECSDPAKRWRILPLKRRPRWLRRRTRPGWDDGYSDEPPF